MTTTTETYQLDIPPQFQQPPPTTKPSRIDILRILSAGFAFFVAGVNDGSFGALVPYVIRNYDITTAIVSSVYFPRPLSTLTKLTISGTVQTSWVGFWVH